MCGGSDAEDPSPANLARTVLVEESIDTYLFSASIAK